MATLDPESLLALLEMDVPNYKPPAPRSFFATAQGYLEGNYLASENMQEPKEENYLIFDDKMKLEVEAILADIAFRLRQAFAFKYRREIGPTMSDVFHAIDVGKEGKDYWTRVAKKNIMIRFEASGEKHLFYSGLPLTLLDLKKAFSGSRWKLIRDFHDAVNGEPRQLKQKQLDQLIYIPLFDLRMPVNEPW